MYLHHNTEARSRYHCYSGKAISIVYPECVFVALFAQHAMRMHVLYCHLWPVRLYNIFARYLTNGTIFGKEVIEHKMCVLIFFTNFVRNISHSKKNSARYN
jgi:hypothetical protein